MFKKSDFFKSVLLEITAMYLIDEAVIKVVTSNDIVTRTCKISEVTTAIHKLHDIFNLNPELANAPTTLVTSSPLGSVPRPSASFVKK